MHIIKNQYIKSEIKLLSFIIVILDIIFYIGQCFFGRYDFSIILGILLGSGYGILNFIFISINMERLISVSSKKAKIIVWLGYIIRYFLMCMMILIVIKNNHIINIFSFLVTLFFHKLAIFIQILLDIKV